MKMFLIFVSILLISGCQPAFINGKPNENSPDFQIPAGSKLVLQKPVVVAAWQEKVYFQNGQSMPWGKANVYFSHCALKLASKKEVAREIRPDTFTVTQSRTERLFKEVQAPEQTPSIQRAAFGSPVLRSATSENDGKMDYEVVASVMTLNSDEQPEVVSMICTDWGLPQDKVHITVGKIRKALGDYFRVELKSN